MSTPWNECPHLVTRTIRTYGWETTCCLDCNGEWRNQICPEGVCPGCIYDGVCDCCGVAFDGE